MKTLQKVITAKAGYFAELSSEDQTLLMQAMETRKKAQAPYSKYHVGVAVRSASGVMYWGCNVERASLTQTTHAEQNAIDSVIAVEGPSKIYVVALAAAPASDENADFIPHEDAPQPIETIEQIPVPCGHCLQIIWENCFNDQTVRLVSRAANGQVTVTTIGDALPMKFGPKELGVDYEELNLEKTLLQRKT